MALIKFCVAHAESDRVGEFSCFCASFDEGIYRMIYFKILWWLFIFFELFLIYLKKPGFPTHAGKVQFAENRNKWLFYFFSVLLSFFVLLLLDFNALK